MSDEKIGSSVLGGGGSSFSNMSPRKRKEIELKVKAELAKQKQEREEQKLPKLTIPGDFTPEPIPGVADWNAMVSEKEKDVHVDEHFRKKPTKKKMPKQEFEEIF